LLVLRGTPQTDPSETEDPFAHFAQSNPDSDDESPPNDSNMSPEDIEAALALLKRLNGASLLGNKQHRPLRNEIRRVFNELSRDDFHGRSPHEHLLHINKSRERKQKLGVMHTLKIADQDRLRKTQMRAERQRAMEKLKLPDWVDSQHMLGGPESKAIDHQPESPQPAEQDGTIAHPGEPITLNYARCCYVCKDKFLQLHHFYHMMCPSCAELNWTKRNFSTDLVMFFHLFLP
jgi:hypothetical protein